MLGRVRSGDTLIEVLFAITVFSLVVVSALALMNQGTAASQRALEVTLVRQQIDNQAETLRFLHESYVAAYGNANSISSSTGPARQFYDIIQRVNATGATSVSELASGAQSCPALPGGSFVLNSQQATLVTNASRFSPADTYAQVTYDAGGALLSSKGIWIEGISSGTNGTTGYIDFHIRSCWATPGQSTVTTLATIVRLYEPRG